MSELKKVSVRRFQTSKNSLSEPNENLLAFWCCSKIFCRFWAWFCINHFNDLQNSKHEKRLETDVSSLRNSVIMRGIKSRLTFGDRCSTNWAIPLNILLLRYEPRSLAENIITQTRGFVKWFFQEKRKSRANRLWEACEKKSVDVRQSEILRMSACQVRVDRFLLLN